MGPTEAHTTIEFKCNFLRSVPRGTLRAEARQVHKGRRTMVLEVAITANDDPRPVALMLVTQAIVPRTPERPVELNR
jgi:uncharacterized protein (TIGR00369 family)